jgi:hypothetical protein
VIHDITRSGIEGQGNDEIEAEKHGTLQVVGFAILDCVRDNENRDGKSDGLD